MFRFDSESTAIFTSHFSHSRRLVSCSVGSVELQHRTNDSGIGQHHSSKQGDLAMHPYRESSLITRSVAFSLLLALAAPSAQGQAILGIQAADFNRDNAFSFLSFAAGQPLLGGGTSPGIVTDGFNSFTIDAQIDSSRFDASGGGGVATAGFGINFDPTMYKLQMTYRPGPNNEQTELRVPIVQIDGLNPDPGPPLLGEEHAYAFFDFQLFYEDAVFFGDISDGDFFTIDSPIALDTPFFSQQSFGDGFRPNPGFAPFDGLTDFDAVQLGGPNGVNSLQLQNCFGCATDVNRLNIEIQEVKIVPINPSNTGERARIDNKGYHFASGSLAATGAVVRDDGSQFTNLFVDATGTGGSLGRNVYEEEDAFDGADYSVKIIAQRLAGNASSTFEVGVLDLDGNDSTAGQGADDFRASVDTSDFSDSSLTTVYVPFSEFAAGGTASGFTNTGDGLLSDFNLLEFSLRTNTDDRLNLEIESLSVVPTPDFAGDYNDDGVVDAADYTVWRDSLGNSGVGLPADGDGDGAIDQDDYNVWVSNFGQQNVAGPATSVAIPEPSTALVAAIGATIALVRRRV